MQNWKYILCISVRTVRNKSEFKNNKNGDKLSVCVVLLFTLKFNTQWTFTEGQVGLKNHSWAEESLPFCGRCLDQKY